MAKIRIRLYLFYNKLDHHGFMAYNKTLIKFKNFIFGKQAVMVFMEWTENFSVKVTLIDEQHKKLFGLINNFYSGFKEKSNKERITELISGLKDYTIYHFSTEERYMEMYNFHDYKNHKKEHDIFIEKIADINERYKGGQLVVSLEITNFIKNWLSNHILVSDKKYSSLFVEKAIK